MDLSEFTDTFFEEADELLVEIESNLLDIDLDNPDSEQLNAVFRAAHSIKGGAGTFGFKVLQDTTHILENLLDDARKGELALNKTIVDQLLETKDMLKDQLDAYRNGTAPDQAVFENLCKTLQRIVDDNRQKGGASTPGPTPGESTETPGESSIDAKSDADSDQSFELFSTDPELDPVLKVTLLNVDDKDRGLIMEELAQLGDIAASDGDNEIFEVELITAESAEDLEAVLCFVIDSQQLQISALESEVKVGDDDGTETMPATADPVNEVASAAEASDDGAPGSNAEAGAVDTKPAQTIAKAKSKSKSAGESSTIRVSVDKLDQVINLVGELIITQSMLNETINGIEGSSNHGDLLGGVNLLQRNARDLQEAVMSIRMLPMDYVFSRFPRVVRDMANKLGKQINLVTEGESTELDKGLTERIIDPLTHLVRNSLDHGIELPEAREATGKPREGTLTLSAQHQGGNILIEVRDDGAGLNREKILAKARAGNIPISDNAPDDDVWQLIFAPGFSTAEQVSDLSGRGVGMDVVKRNIHSMGGHVEINSRPGHGTTTRIVLPLTLAILDGMLIRVAGEIYILPVSSIIESLQLRDENLSYLPGSMPMLKVRDAFYPVVSIYDAMGMHDGGPAENASERKTAVMVQGGGLTYVMLVDELLGQQQVVVKNLESNYRKIQGVSAATILGDGSVALILDISDLYRLGGALRPRQRRSVNANPLDQKSSNERLEAPVEPDSASLVEAANTDPSEDPIEAESTA